MEHFFSYLLLLLLIMFGMLAPKSKVVKYCIMAMVFIFIAFSHDEYDLNVYLREYAIIGSGGESQYEIMFVLASRLGNSFGLDYYQFRAVLAVIELLVLDSIISKQTKYSTYVWTLYLVFSAIYDATLLRFFMGMIFALLAIKLIKHQKRYSFREIIVYYLWVVMAALSHSSFWLLLFLLPLSLVRNRTKLIIISSTTVAIFLGGFIDVIRNLYALLPIRDYTLDKYFQGHYANINGLIFDCLAQIISMLPAVIAWFALRKPKRNTFELSDTEEKVTDELNLWITLNIIFCLILPFQLIAVNMSRLQRLLSITNYIFMAKMMSYYPQKRIRFQLGGLLYAAFLLFFTMVIASTTNVEIVWNTMFDLNTIFKLLG